MIESETSLREGQNSYGIVKISMAIIGILYRIENGGIVAYQHHASGRHQANIPTSVRCDVRCVSL